MAAVGGDKCILRVYNTFNTRINILRIFILNKKKIYIYMRVCVLSKYAGREIEKKKRLLNNLMR